MKVKRPMRLRPHRRGERMVDGDGMAGTRRIFASSDVAEGGGAGGWFRLLFPVKPRFYPS